MTKSILLFTMLGAFAVSCGHPLRVKDPREFTDSDPEFEEYSDLFVELGGMTVTHIPINFKYLEEKIAGTCKWWDQMGQRFSEIYIDPEHWDNLSEDQRLNLIFHELGHCARRRKHVPDKFEDGCPTSFMYKNVMGNRCIENYWDYYVEEMFGESVRRLQ